MKVNSKNIRAIKNHLVCFGPKRQGTNLLLNHLIEPSESIFWKVK